MRYLLALPAGILMALLLFSGVAFMVAPPSVITDSSQTAQQVNFLRAPEDTSLQHRERTLPPPPEPPVSPAAPSVSTTATINPPALSMPTIVADLTVSTQGQMGDLLSGISVADKEVMPLVRPAATYPSRALARRIEGRVTARLSITPEGTVSDVDVINSEPPGIFDREAVRALYRYRFEPKTVNGVAVAQTATQTIEFSLQ